MGLSHLSFLRDWKNPADFPTVEPDEATVRADLQYHPDAIKKYINETLIPSHDALTSAKHSHDNKTVLDGITADDVAKWRGTIGTFRINVTYSGGVYSADKTFDEIKAAYDAGQQPYVVSGGDMIYTLSYCYFASEQMYMAFERYLIREDTLETETLRIYSYTLANGSNIEQRISAFNVPNGTTYVKVSSPGGVITTVHGETYSDIKTLINAGKPVVVRYGDVLDFYYFETSEFSNSSGTHHRVNFRCDMGDSVYTLTLRDDNTWAFSENSLQPSSITDAGGYFTTDTVEGALQEIGAGLAGAYRKPSSGIPKTDLAEAVQISLGKADTALQEHQSLAAYRKAADQDAIDATKQGIITDLETIRSGAALGATAVQPEAGKSLFSGSYNDLTNKPTIPDISGKQDKLIAGEGITIAADGKTISSSGGGKVSSVNGKTGVVTLNATEIPSTKLVPTDTISFLIDGAFDEALVELTRNGASASANDFISAINSGSPVTVGLRDSGNPKVTFEDAPVKYKITNDTLSLYFIAEIGHQYSPALYVLSGPISGTTVSNLTEYTGSDPVYQEHYVSANNLPVQAIMTVAQYLEELESNVDALQPKSITDTGSYFTTDTVEGALQEIGAELAGINTLIGSGEVTS